MKLPLVTAIALMGCVAEPEVVVRFHSQADPSYDDQRSKWVLECIQRANPHSDEEPEDYVRQCAIEGRTLWTIRTAMVKTDDFEWIPCSEATGQLAEACESIESELQQEDHD